MGYLKKIEMEIKTLGFQIISKDFNRPWGGFLVIKESQTIKFLNYFFQGIDINTSSKKISPKILIVKPKNKLSWQYHHRRSEIWKVFKGKCGIIKSNSDIQSKIKIICEGDYVKIKKGERHRLIGLKDYCVVAEIWQHTDINNLSDEDDIVRIEDDYSR